MIIKKIKILLKSIFIFLVVLFLFSAGDAFALNTSEGDGILFYGAASNTTPQFKLYTNSTNNFGINGSTIAGAQPAMMVIKTSPTKQEAIGAYQDTSGNLRVLCYDGTTWTQDWTVAVAATGTPTTRRFDISYETATGDVTVAYSRNTAAVNALAYRTKSGTTACGSANWSAATNFPTTTTATSATVQWVKAARDGRSGQNLSTWVWRDNAATNADLGAAVWNGAAFSNFKVVETSMEHISTTGDIDNFDVQYESLSGDVMVVWGNSAGTNGTNGSRYMTCTGGTATCTWGTATAIPSLLDDATTLDLSADPLSDKIVFASIGNAGSDLQAAYWSGTAWTGYPNVDTTTETPAIGMKLVTTGWLTNNGNTKWYLSYDDASGTGISWRYAVPGSASTAATDFTSTPAINDIRGRYDTDINPFNPSELIQTISDSTNNIFAYRLSMNTSGTLTWSNMGSAVSLGKKASHPQQGFSYTYWRFIPVPTTSPTVTTQAVTDNTTGNEVMGNGTVVSDGNSSITERGFVWSTSMDPTINDYRVIVSGTVGIFSALITGLNENTLYYVRAYATNSLGTSYGDNVIFTTPIAQVTPTIVSNTADAYDFGTDTTPTIEMTATDTNGDDVQYNVQINNSTNFTTQILNKFSSSDSGFLNTVSGGDIQPFTSGNKVSYTVQPADALASGTYYWRAQAIDPLGTNTYSSWTAIRSFIIIPSVLLPTIITQDVTNITATTATANGNITNTGNENNDKRGIVYDTSSHSLPGNVTPASSLYLSEAEETGSFNTGTFTINLTGLTQNTTYYVRAYSHNSMGYSYGGEVLFTATAPLLNTSGVLTSSVFDTTGATSSVGYNSVMWKGSLGGAGQNEGKVKFQLAASSSPSGPWNYYGGSTCGALDWFDTAGPNVPILLKGSNCVSNWNNKRYYRYKVMLCSNDCITAGTSTPVVNKIIINWSN